MLDRLNKILDSWERRNERTHWSSSLAKTILSFGVAAGAVAAGTSSADAALACNCSTRACNPSCVSCGSSWYCLDDRNCCSVVYTSHCFPDDPELDDYYCGGTVQPMC